MRKEVLPAGIYVESVGAVGQGSIVVVRGFTNGPGFQVGNKKSLNEALKQASEMNAAQRERRNGNGSNGSGAK